MKKISKILLTTTIMLSFAACGEDTPFNEPATPEESKDIIQETAIEFMNEFHASNFDDIIDMTEYFVNTYSEYETDELTSWLGDCFGEVSKEIESKNSYPVYETIYKASAFKGKFVAEDGSWKRYDSDNLSIHMKDQNGNPCEVTITTSGDTKKVHCCDDWDGYWDTYYDSEKEEWYENKVIESEEYIWVEVPENLTIVLNQNGEKLAEAVINADLSSMQGDDFNLSKDKYNVNTSVYFNGYSFSTENISYANNKELKTAFNFKNGNKLLLAASLSVTPKIDVPNAGFEDDEFLETVESTNNSAVVNILGKMEFRGNCNSFRKVIDVISEEEWDSRTALSLNPLFNVNVYFNGAVLPTAKLEFESFQDGYYDWDGLYQVEYDLEPIIVFTDGTRHSFGDFFNERDFKMTIDAFNALIDEYIAMEDRFEDMLDKLEDSLE